MFKNKELNRDRRIKHNIVLLVLSFISLFIPLSIAIYGALNTPENRNNKSDVKSTVEFDEHTNPSSSTSSEEKWNPTGIKELDEKLNSGGAKIKLRGKIIQRFPYKLPGDEKIYEIEVNSIVIKQYDDVFTYTLEGKRLLFRTGYNFDELIGGEKEYEFEGDLNKPQKYGTYGKTGTVIISMRDPVSQKDGGYYYYEESYSPEIQSGNDSTTSSSQERKVDLEAYYGSVQSAIDTMNMKSGNEMLTMERTSVTPGIRINLSEIIASYTDSEIRKIISALNETFYKIAHSYGIESPRFYYYISDEEVAVNQYVMEPNRVKFKGSLK